MCRKKKENYFKREFKLLISTILFIIFFSFSNVNGQSAYKGGQGDGYASDKIEGISIKGAILFSPINLFPNPLTNSLLNISFPELPVEKVQIILADVIGRTCYSNELEITTNTYRLQLPQLASGTYFIYIKTDKEEFKDKIIIIKE